MVLQNTGTGLCVKTKNMAVLNAKKRVNPYTDAHYCTAGVTPVAKGVIASYYKGGPHLLTYEGHLVVGNLVWLSGHHLGA